MKIRTQGRLPLIAALVREVELLTRRAHKWKRRAAELEESQADAVVSASLSPASKVADPTPNALANELLPILQQHSQGETAKATLERLLAERAGYQLAAEGIQRFQAAIVDVLGPLRQGDESPEDAMRRIVRERENFSNECLVEDGLGWSARQLRVLQCKSEAALTRAPMKVSTGADLVLVGAKVVKNMWGKTS
jgi:hypothetical protein